MRLIDADILEKEGWSLCRTYRKDKETTVYEVKTISEINTTQPTVDAVPVIRCKDCKYFELDYVDREAMGIPLIMAHEICMRWGDGCKTSPDGYCFMAERREE